MAVLVTFILLACAAVGSYATFAIVSFLEIRHVQASQKNPTPNDIYKH